jgi:hypothetical protein
VPHFQFTLFVDGLDLLADRAQETLDQLAIEVEGLDIENVEGDVVGDDVDLAVRALGYRSSR